MILVAAFRCVCGSYPRLFKPHVTSDDLVATTTLEVYIFWSLKDHTSLENTKNFKNWFVKILNFCKCQYTVVQVLPKKDKSEKSKVCIQKRSDKNFKAPDFWFGRRFLGRWRDRSVSSFVHRHRRINILEVTSEMSPPLLLHSRNSVQQSARWNFFELKSHRPYPRTLRTKYDLTKFCFLSLSENIRFLLKVWVSLLSDVFTMLCQ